MRLAIILGIGVVVGGSVLWVMLKPSTPTTSIASTITSSTVNGSVITAASVALSTTNINNGPRCPELPSPDALAALRAAVDKHRTPERFVLEVPPGVDRECNEAVVAIGRVLLAGGWQLAKPGLAERIDAPAPGGLVLSAQEGSQAAQLIQGWATSVGLPNRLDSYPKWDPYVTILVGNLSSHQAAR